MRNLGLDILRIVAVVLVLGRHLHPPQDSNVFLRAWNCGGWVGVDLFFVLSGFLISSLLFKEQLRSGTVNTKRFLIRRGFRIYPAFWCFLAFSILVGYFQSGTGPRLRPLIGELLFFQNYLGGLWNHTWSLAVEEHFYIGIAVLFTLVAKHRPNHRFEFIPLLFVVVSVFCLLTRISNLYVFPEYSHQAYLFGTHIRIDSLFFGVFISYLFHFHELQARISWIPSLALIAIGMLLLSPAFVFPLTTNKWISIVGVIPFYIGSGALLLAAIRLRTSDSRLLLVLGSLGAASYSIYLWHMPVNEWGYPLVRNLIGIDSWFLYLCIYIIGACLFGWFMNRVIEKPVLAIRDSLIPSDTSKLAVEQNNSL